MVVDERARHALHTRLEKSLGARGGDHSDESSPARGLADVATKHDLDAQTTQLRTEMGKLAAELRGELHSEIGGLRGEMHRGFSDVYKATAAQTRMLVIGFVTTFVAMAGVVVGAAQLT